MSAVPSFDPRAASVAQGRGDATAAAQEIAAVLNVLLEPGQRFEIRTIRKSVVRSRFFSTAQIEAAARYALGQSGRADGVYFSLNKLRPDLTTGSAKDEDVIRRRLLLIDADPKRLGVVSATDAEKAKAQRAIQEVRAYLTQNGWPGPVEADSGNGNHLIYRVDLPNDDDSNELVKAVLKALASRFDTEAVTIDTVVSNASRICKLYGTVARKGEPTAERPHRLSRLIRVPEAFVPVAVELLRAVADSYQPERKPEPEPATVKFPARTAVGGWTPERRASAYLEKCEPAIAGQKGHDAAFKAAVAIGPGFDLPPEVALRLLSQEYNPRCVPPWSDKELRHKVSEAYKVESRRGWLLEAGSVSFVGGLNHTNPVLRGSKSEECVKCVTFTSDPRPIRANLRPVPPMVRELIPEPFRGWLTDIADRACCPLDLPVMSATVSVGALIGRRIGVRPKRRDDWLTVPNLWGMGVLPPGWLKSHSLDEPKKPLARLEIEAREKYAQALRDFEVSQLIAETRAAAASSALKEATKKGKSDAELRRLATEATAKPELDPPKLRRYIVNDATTEKLGELLVDNPTGVLVFRDELMGWLKSLEKQGQESARAFYLEGWNGTGSFTYDRIGRGSVFIPSNTISILGGIQPGRLASYIRSTASGENDDGLISRFQLAVYPDVNQPFRNVDDWPDTEAKNRAYRIFQALDALDPFSIGATVDEGDTAGIPYLRFADDAQELFDQWRTDLENKVRSSNESAALISHLSKYRSLMPSLALVFHLLDVVPAGAHGPVSLSSVRLAAAWCDYLEAHARRIYQVAFEGDIEPAQRLADRLAQSLSNPFTVRDVVRKGWAGLDSTDEVERAVSILEDHDHVQRIEIPPESQGGRPKTEIWINPRLRKEEP